MTYLDPTDNYPSPTRLLDSLRSTGYDVTTAVGDILDNSIDAQAKKIDTYINYDKETGYEFIFVDNGNGMDYEILDDAMKLGSEKANYSQSSLGIFGFGLITASIGLCKRVEVYTKTDQSNDILISVQDLDVLFEEDMFRKDGPRKASKEEEKLFNKYLVNVFSGTIVRWLKCDRIIDVNTKRVINSVKNKISKIYRSFMELPGDAKIEFTMNGDLIEPADPMWLKHPETEVWSDEYYLMKLKEKGIEAIEENIRCRLILLPKFEYQQAREYKINEKTSGFHIFRNNRVILEGQTLNMFRKNPIRNRFRGEIYLPSSLDDHIGINFTKMILDISQQLIDQLKQHLGPQITSINRKAHSQMKRTIRKDIDFSDIEKFISQRSSFLVKPRREKEIRKSPEVKPKHKKKSQNDLTRKEKNIVTRRRLRRKDIIKSLESRCKFQPRSLGENGPVYDAYTEGKIMLIDINTDHPFYERFILETEENVDFFNCVGYLIYSMASADNLIEDEEITNVLRPWKTFMSTNLYGLLTNR